MTMKVDFLAAAVLLIVLSGCVTVHDTLMLRNVNVEASLPQPPVHVTTPEASHPTFYASPFLSVGSGSVSASLDHQYDGPISEGLTAFDAEGLHWTLPQFTYGAHLDFVASRALALSAGGAASTGRGRQNGSFYGGIGLRSALENIGLRLDLGMQFINVRYEGATVVLRSLDNVPSDTLYYLDRGTTLQPNFYANLTLNSSRQDWPANWFVQAGVSPQTLTSFVPRERASESPGFYIVEDQRAESGVLWLTITPGIYLSVPADHRLLIGVRIMKEMQAESAQPGLLLLPMASFDWRL